MQMIRCTAKSCRRNHLTVFNHLRQCSYNFVHACTCTSMIGIHHLSSNERHFISLKIQISKQIIINILYLHRPFLITGIRFSLMQQNTFNNSILLSYSGHLDQSLVRIIIIFLKHSLHPVRSCLYIFLTGIFLKKFNTTSTNSHVHNTNSHIFRKILYHSSTEIIGRCQSCTLPAQWCTCRIPFTFNSSHLIIIYSRKDLKTRVDNSVLRFISGISFHIGLSQTQINIKIRVLGISHHTIQQQT